MNCFCFEGRLTEKPELRYSKNNKEYTKFTLALDSRKRDEEGKAFPVFFNFIANGHTATSICQYAHKGQVLSGEATIESYRFIDINGKTCTAYNGLVRQIYFGAQAQSNLIDEEATLLTKEQESSEVGAAQQSEDNIPEKPTVKEIPFATDNPQNDIKEESLGNKDGEKPSHFETDEFDTMQDEYDSSQGDVTDYSAFL